MAAILDVYKGTNGNQYSDWATSSYGDVMGQLFYYLSVDSTTCSIYIGSLSVLAKKSNNYSAATTGHWRWRTFHSNPNTSYPSSSTLYTDSTNRSISTSYARLDNGTANTYTPAFTINANALSWNNTYTEGTFTISGRVVKPSGTSNADTDSRQATPSQTIKLHLNEVSWSQKDVTKTLNYSSSDQFVTTIAEPTGGSGSFTYTLTGDTGYLYLSDRNIYAKGGTSYLTGYSNKQVSVVVKDKYTGRDIAQDVGVVVTVTMKPKTYTVSYNSNGTNVSNMPSNQTKTHGQTLKLSSTKPTCTGYTFNKWNTASNGNGTSYNAGANYTANAAATLYAQWTANSQTNNIEHWAWGFQNGEGNNGTKNAFKFKNTTFSAYTDASITLNNSRATTIPNGYDLMTNISTNSVDNTGAWTSHSLPFTTTQKPNSMLFQYGYIPFTYNITYNLDGGINNSANPSTYTVLYGVTFSNPTKTGYIFSHWTDANGTTITGINPGVNASFSSGDDLYSKLSTRTIGDQTVTAHWTMITYNIEYNLNGGNLANQSINSNKVIVNPRGVLTYNPANGDTIQQNYFQLTFPTKIGYKFIGWTITGMDTSPHRFWYKDNNASNSSWHDSNSTSFNNLNINNKNLYVFHPTATDGATIIITANWQFRGNYIYKNDTDKWVKVVPFVYNGSTWRETQPFVYTSNGWKSLIN